MAKQTPEEILQNRHVKRPSKFWSVFFRILLAFKAKSQKVKYVYLFDKKEMKNKQVILLSDHASRDNFYFMLNGYPFADPNILMGYQNLFDKKMFKLFLKAGIIPKMLYVPDGRATKEMLRLLKEGASLCLFPEGIQSTCGFSHPMNPATMKFIKHAGVDVVLCSSRGAYLTRPRFAKKYRNGEMTYEYRLLYSKEELASKSLDELYAKYLQYFKYNDFEWNKTARVAFKGKEPNAKGFETILYKCPKCGEEFCIESQGENLVCTHCGNTLHVNEYYDVTPVGDSVFPFERLDQWYKYQRECVRKEVADVNFSVTYPAYVRELHTEKLYKDKYYTSGEGVVTISHKGIRYVGTRKGENVDFLLDINAIPSFPAQPNDSNEMYYNNKYISFMPFDKIRVSKYLLIVEELHNLYDPAWKKCSDDMYN